MPLYPETSSHTSSEGILGSVPGVWMSRVSWAPLFFRGCRDLEPTDKSPPQKPWWFLRPLAFLSGLTGLFSGVNFQGGYNMTWRRKTTRSSHTADGRNPAPPDMHASWNPVNYGVFIVFYRIIKGQCKKISYQASSCPIGRDVFFL